MRPRTQEVFEEALGVPPTERDSFIRERCDGDEVLVGEVRSLLSAYKEAKGFLELPLQQDRLDPNAGEHPESETNGRSGPSLLRTVHRILKQILRP
ncbi:MAG: hypothetical protein AAFX79_00220 [Planctomycetota bacterium]